MLYLFSQYLVHYHGKVHCLLTLSHSTGFLVPSVKFDCPHCCYCQRSLEDPYWVASRTQYLSTPWLMAAQAVSYQQRSQMHSWDDETSGDSQNHLTWHSGLFLGCLKNCPVNTLQLLIHLLLFDQLEWYSGMKKVNQKSFNFRSNLEKHLCIVQGLSTDRA